MLKVAKNEFKANPSLRKFTITADELLVFFGFGGKNHKYIEEELNKLRKIDVRNNILNKDKKGERSG
jgi:hypothetical protein